MYDSMTEELHWSFMTNIVYTTVFHSRSCAPERVNGKKQRQLELFSTDRPPEYVGLDTLVLLREIKQGNELIIVMTDRFGKLAKAILAPKTYSKQLLASS